MKILIVRVSAIGDVVHTLPVVFMIKKVYPHASISWVVQEKAAHLLVTQPFLEHVWVLPDKFLYQKNWKETYKIINEMREITWDAILDFQGLLKTSFIYLFLRGTKYGFCAQEARERLSTWATHKRICPVYDNIVQKNLALASFMLEDKLGIKACPSPDDLHKACILFFSQENKRAVEFWLGVHAVTSFIILAPNTTWPSKHWPEACWQKLLFMLAQDHFVNKTNTKIVLAGCSFGASAKNLAYFAEHVGLINTVVAPGWDLLTMAYLIKRASLVVAPDTGLLHVADYLGTLTVGIFGPTRVYKHGPFWVAANKKSALQVDCPHFYEKTHGKNKDNSVKQDCMFKLTPQMVYTSIQECMVSSWGNGV